MSLLNGAFEKCTIIDKRTTSDGEGGAITEWIDGAKFDAAIVTDNSVEIRVAAVQGVKSLYTVTTRKSIILRYHDIFRREADGKIFRVTSDGDDVATPAMSTLNIRQVTAEEWKLS